MRKYIIVALVLFGTTLSVAGAQQAADPTLDRVRALEETIASLKQQIGILQGHVAELARRIETARSDERRAIGRSINVAGAAFKGAQSAPVILIEFADFRCPFCRRHASQTLPLLVRDYVALGKVQYVFLNFPLDRLHPDARDLALAGVCADRQGTFWSFHQLMFGQKGSAPAALSTATLRSIGLSRDDLKACMDQPETTARVRSHANLARELGLASTPSFIVARRDTGNIVTVATVITGAQPAGVFQEALDDLLTTSQTKQGK